MTGYMEWDELKASGLANICLSVSVLLLSMCGPRVSAKPPGAFLFKLK